MISLRAFDSHSGLWIETPSSTLIFDPIGIKVGEVSGADAIVITHEHPDHLDIQRVVALQQRTGAHVVTTPFVVSLLPGLPADRLYPLRIGETLALDGVRLRAERSNHPGRQPLAFLLTTEEGIRLYHPSDSDPFPEMEQLAEEGGPDIVLYLGGSLEKGLQIAQLVRPRVFLFRYLDPSRVIPRLEAGFREIRGEILRPLQTYRYPSSPGLGI